MKLKAQKIAALALVSVICVMIFAGCANKAEAKETKIHLSDSGITVDGAAAGEDGAAAVYLSHDIIYYEDRDTYGSGNPYGEGTENDRRSESEAAAHTVVNIKAAGTYRISGKLSKGQIFVDLGEDAKTDKNAVVNLILDNADITCTVAPAVFFYRVYECDEAWTAFDGGDSEQYNGSYTQNTAAAGANVIIADGSENNINGSYVARIYKDGEGEKKLHKYDGAFYSRCSMNIDGGTGVLNITADNEGLDSEVHLTINGGNINITADNDGINTNEDGVSVTAINGGTLHIAAGLGDEGDGIDSNGYIVINGGTVVSHAKPQADSGLDSDSGIYINGGIVIATGSGMDRPAADSKQAVMNLSFNEGKGVQDTIIIADKDGKTVFAYDMSKDSTAAGLDRKYTAASISTPKLTEGESYTVYIGGTVSGSEIGGVYDADTVTGFDGAVLQQYTGTNFGMGQPPEMPQGDMPQNGTEPPQMPEDSNKPPEMPIGEKPSDGAEPPEMPKDGDKNGIPYQGEKPSNGNSGAAADAKTEFRLTESVNNFGGVSDTKG